MASPHDFVVSDELLQKYEMTRTELANRLNAHLQHTLLGALDMRYAELSTDRVVMRMPVSAKTRQLFGFLHGGASVALAETAASVAALLNIDSRTHAAFGMEINANHIRSKKDGTVTATAVPLHKGRTSMVWDVRITDEQENLICVSRCTVAVVPIREADQESWPAFP